MASAVTLPPVSNAEDWRETIQVFDTDGEPFDLGAVTAIELVVWDPGTRASMLSLALGSGITIDDEAEGVISIVVEVGSMDEFCAKNYAFRLGMVSGGVTQDLINPGILPVIDGGP